MIKSFEDFQTLSKDGYEAFIASGTALTKGFQAIAQEATDFSRKSFEKGTEVVEKATATRSFEKALEVQQGYAKEAYEAFVAEAAKPSTSRKTQNRNKQTAYAIAKVRRHPDNRSPPHRLFRRWADLLGVRIRDHPRHGWSHASTGGDL